MFAASDFHETRRGACRLLPPLTHRLAETSLNWGQQIAPTAEHVAAMFAKAPGSRVDRLPTPLTQANRLAGREVMRRNNRRPRANDPMQRCRACGERLPHKEGAYCDTCLPAYRHEQFVGSFSGTGLAKLEQLKAAGQDPTHGGEAGVKRGATNARRKAELRDWEQQFGKLVDLSAFEREILPGHQRCSA